MNGSHWHDCRLVLGPGQLRLVAEHYVGDGSPPAGRNVAVLPVRLPDDPGRAEQVESLVRASWDRPASGHTTEPTDVVATVDRVTIISGRHVVDLRAEGIAAFGNVMGFQGRLAWVAPSLCDGDEGEFLVRVDLSRSRRRPRHRSLLLTLDTSLAPVDLPEPGTPVRGSHYRNGQVAMAGTVDGGVEAGSPWLAGWLLTAPDVIALPGRPRGRPAASGHSPDDGPPTRRSTEPRRPDPRPGGAQPIDEEPF